MEAIIIHPKNKRQLTALKTIFEEMKIPFEKAEMGESPSVVEGLSAGQAGMPQGMPYDPAFVKKIKESEKQIAQGNFTSYTLEESEKLCR